MATANNKRIEESATTALKSALLCCPILDSYIDSNDKTPSWDGSVFVYRNEKQKKCDLIGKVPIQVKGTETRFSSKIATFSCSLDDIKNYYNGGGCLFFLVSVTPSTGDHKIFYSNLLVYDLKKIIDKAGKQKTYTIHLSEFPEGDTNEISIIFLTFVENSPKQMSFIGKDICSLESLQQNGVDIESFTFNTSGVGLNEMNIGSFLTTHDFYLYAKPKGLDVEIPVEKVSGAIVARTVNRPVAVKDTVHYGSYNIIYENGKPYFQIGKGIKITLTLETNKVDVNFKPTGTLDDFIRDVTCFVDMLENREIVLNGGKLAFSGTPNIDFERRKSSLSYYKEVKKMLDLLGVVEELQCDKLSENDEKNIRNFTNAVLYNKEIGFPEAKDNIVYGRFIINNLHIWIWAERQESGFYRVNSFFTPHPLALFSNEDVRKENPISASQFLLMTKEAFVHTSNMDYEMIIQDIQHMQYNPLLCDRVTHLMLDVLTAYDEQSQKESKLLDLAEAISEWLLSGGPESDLQVQSLNHFQIIKRKRNLSISEILEVGKLIDKTNAFTIRCGAYLLLGEEEEAQNCFDQLTAEEQNDFLSYPICVFGKLEKKEE